MELKRYKIEGDLENRSFDADIRLLIVKEDGSVDAIFSSDDCSCKNLVSLSSGDDLNEITLFYEKIKDTVYNNDDSKDRHLFYMKQYLKDHFAQQFESKNINIGKINDDILLYYYLSTMNNMVFVNSSEHSNIAILPNEGLSFLQSNRLSAIGDLFVPNKLWELTDSMHLETFEHQGATYATIEVGNSISGTIHDVIDKYQKSGETFKK